MRTAYKTLLAAVVPALIVSACSGGSAGSGAPTNTLPIMARHQAIQPFAAEPASALHAGGATFPAYAYNLGSQPTGISSTGQPGPGAGSLFASAGTTGTIYYCLTGSGFGRANFTGSTPSNVTAPCAALGLTPTGFGGPSDPPDFVGSDVGMKSTDWTEYKSVRMPAHGTNYGAPFQFPIIGGPVVFGYRTEDFSKIAPPGRLHLSTWTYCAIVNGTVKNWADPAIVADNHGPVNVDNPSEPINFFYRSDSSGTTYNLQNHLAAACGSSWPAPYNAAPYQSGSRSAAWTFGSGSSNWVGPQTGNFHGESGNPGVLAAIQGQQYGLGYVEGAWAKSASNPTISQAMLQNKAGDFRDPTDAASVTVALKTAGITFAEGSDGKHIDGDPAPTCWMFMNPANFDNPAATTAYPIVAISYLMFYGNNNGVHVADKEKLIKYLVSGSATTLISNLEYSPVAPTVQTRILDAVNGTGPYAGGHACIK